MKIPTVTVAIPSYNRGRYIGTTIKSVLEQTHPVDEIIVVENASKDDSIDVVRSFADPRIRVYQNVRTFDGTTNWNLCYSLSSGDYVLLLHADDSLHPTMIEKLLTRAQREPDVVMVNCDYEMVFVDQGGQSRAFGMWHHHGDAVRNQSFDGHTINEMMLRRGDNSIGTTSMQLIRRDAVLAVGGLDPSVVFTTDWDFSMRLFANHGGIANVAEPLVRYSMHAANGTNDDQSLDNDVRGHFELLKRVVSPEQPYGALAADAVNAYRVRAASHLVSRLQQVVGMDYRDMRPEFPSKEWRLERLVGWARDPVFAGVIQFQNQPQAATTPA